MALETSGLAGQYIRTSVATTDLNTTDVTRAFWVRIRTGSANSANGRIVESGGFGGLGNSGVTLSFRNANRWQCYILLGGTGFRRVGSPYSFAFDTWLHVIMDSSNSLPRHRFFVNGVNLGTDTTGARTTTDANTITIGNSDGGTQDNPCQPQVCELGHWNVILGTRERAFLAGGGSPELVRRANLVEYSPLYDSTDGHTERIGPGTWDWQAAGNSHTTVAHKPGIINPTQGWAMGPRVVAAPVDGIEHILSASELQTSLLSDSSRRGEERARQLLDMWQ